MSRQKLKFCDMEAVQKGCTDKKNDANPKYIAYTGISYGGRCNNPNCTHYKQLVTFNKGKGTQIQPYTDKIRGLVKCPGCKTKFVIEEVILYDCDCTIEFVYFDDKDEELQERHHKPSGEEFVRLGKGTDGVTLWKHYSFLEMQCK